MLHGTRVAYLWEIRAGARGRSFTYHLVLLQVAVILLTSMAPHSCSASHPLFYASSTANKSSSKDQAAVLRSAAETVLSELSAKPFCRLRPQLLLQEFYNCVDVTSAECFRPENNYTDISWRGGSANVITSSSSFEKFVSRTNNDIYRPRYVFVISTGHVGR